MYQHNIMGVPKSKGRTLPSFREGCLPQTMIGEEAEIMQGARLKFFMVIWEFDLIFQ